MCANSPREEQAMSCSGLVVVLSLLGQVPPPPWARTPLASWKQRGGRSWRTKAASSKAWPSDWPTKAIKRPPGRFASGCPDRSTRMAQRVSFRYPKWSWPVPAKMGVSRGVRVSSEIESRSAQELFKLAQRAAKTDPPSYSLASVCLRAVIERQPDHREARRLLGYVPHEGGWARPFAVSQLKNGCVSHPIFGWVRADWVPHLDRGELPAPSATRGQKKARWLSAAEADGLRANWSPPWQISTEHFEIQTNVTMAEAITFGRRLEAFHDLFMALFADILGENLPLVRRFKDPSMTGEPAYRPHSVYYFGSKSEYVDYLSPSQGPDIAQDPRLLPSAQSRAAAAA